METGLTITVRKAIAVHSLAAAADKATATKMHLNIPLSTNQMTRPKFKGRVLWICAGWLFVAFLAFIGSNLWFTRDTLTSYAPEGTIATIHLSLSTKEWTKLITDFGNLPLITDRPLTITDLASFKAKEIAIFVLSNNNSAVTIRTNEKNLDKPLLQSLGITLQKLDKNRWLLSNQPLPYSTKQKTDFSLAFIRPNVLGKVNYGDFSGFLSVNKKGYSLEIPKIKKTSDLLPNLPEDTLAAVAIQTKSEIDFSAVFSKFNDFVSQFNNSTKLLDKEIRENGGIVLVTKSGFLLETDLEASTVPQILESGASFRNLTEKPLVMPDGTMVKELVINESSVNFTSFWLNGLEVKSSGDLFAVENEENDVISSNQGLLEDYLKNKGKETRQFAYFEPKNIRSELIGLAKSTKKPNLLDFLFVFSQIYIEQNKIFLIY